MNTLKQKINAIMEAPLNQARIAKLDQLIQQLQTAKELDYGINGIGYTNHIDDYLNTITTAIGILHTTGKNTQQLDKEQQIRNKHQELTQIHNKTIKKIKTIAEQFAQQFPRHIVALTDHIKIIQPNGDYLEYNIPAPQIIQHHQTDYLDKITKTYQERRKNKLQEFTELILAFRQLYNTGAYKEAEERVQHLRDYGFNISSKLVSTKFATFRTRYAIISDILISYEGPIVKATNTRTENEQHTNTKYEIKNTKIPGECTIAYTSRPTPQHIKVQNTTLDHLGEIIDTIDTIVHHIYPIGKIDEIMCLGDNIVEYTIAPYIAKNHKKITLPSTLADNKEQLHRTIYQQLQNINR
jgi:hypothetical protein